MDDNKVELLMQGRQLVHTSYEVTAIQNRIFYYCLLNAQKESNGSLCCDIELDKLQRLIPNTNQRTLVNVKKALNVLSNTSLEFEVREEDDDIECDYKLIAGSEYSRNKRRFKIFFMERLYKHIINYTVYAPLNLDILTKFKSFYSQRLYELLRLWSRCGEVVIKEFRVDQLRFVLGTDDKYPNYKNFKQRALAQAIKEINDVGNMKVSIEEVKKSRRVEAIRFSILDHETKTYFKNRQADIAGTVEKKDNITLVEKTDAVKDFYVPNKKLFTSKTLADFINDFSSYDFKESKNKKALQESILAALEKDNEEKIKVKAYNYFKVTLEDRLKKTINPDTDVKKVKTRYHNINQSFEKYGADELEKKLLDMQRSKGMLPDSKNKFRNFEETFTRYSEDEFNEIVEMSQKEKFGI